MSKPLSAKQRFFKLPQTNSLTEGKGWKEKSNGVLLSIYRCPAHETELRGAELLQFQPSCCSVLSNRFHVVYTRIKPRDLRRCAH